MVAHPALRFGVAPGGLGLTPLIRSFGPVSRRSKRPGVVDRYHPWSGCVPKVPHGPPRFPENPTMPSPCSQIPARPRRLALNGAPVLPPITPTSRTPATYTISGLNHTASAFTVYASCRPHGRRRKTRFRVVANRFRMGLDTHRVLFEQFPACAFPCSWAFPGARTLSVHF